MADEPEEETTGGDDAAEVVSDETDDTRKKTQVLRTVAVDEIPERGPAAYIAEFIGTFFLTMFICAIVSVTVQAPIHNPDGSTTIPFVDWTAISFVHLLVLFALIQTLAIVSGAHFNPAVTAALTAIRQIRPADAGIYVICQFAGGVLGALVVKLMFEDEGKASQYGSPTIHSTFADGKVSIAFAAELIGTFILVWTICGVAVHPRGLAAWSGLAIGGALGLAEFVFGRVSGGAFNPARAFGPSLVGAFDGGTGKWILAFVVAPLLGGALAAVSYHQLFILPGKKGIEGMGPVG
jgi:glycerol uptake facilitator protein